MTKYRKYLFNTIKVVLLLLLLTSAINFLVDPYGLFRIVEIKGFNQQKEGIRSKIRFVKSLELPLRKPGTVLIGSSRVHDGMNPDHPLLQEYGPVYNMGIDMLRICEATEYLKHCVINTDVRRVIFGIDFFMFNAAERVNPSFDHKVVGRKINIIDYFKAPLITSDALTGSWNTIKTSNNYEERNEFLANGFRPGNYVFYKVKDYRKLHCYTNWIFLSHDPLTSPYYGIYKTDDETFRHFEEFVRICRSKNIDLKIFISPAHANLDGEAIRVAGLWNYFEEWKRKVTRICSQNGVTLWDFSGYNSITTETVITPMKYYWDSSHYTEKTSDLILKRIFNKSSGNKNILYDFGVELTPQNIEKHLEDTRSARELYVKTHKEEVELIQQIYNYAKNGLPLPAEQTTGMFDN